MNDHLHAVARGLILGEALSWTGLYHRSFLLPFWTRRKRREIASQHEGDGLLELSLPFALNQPTAAFKPGPGPNSEWFAFQLQIILDNGGHYAADRALAAWWNLVKERENLRLTIGQHAALENLAKDKRPPVSGHDNPHYFDDSACFRAAALALTTAAETLAERVYEDASITNAKDGVWAAQAYAIALASALRTGDILASLDEARAYLPKGSWVGQCMDVAIQASETAESLFDLIHRLSLELVNDAYNYGNSAPETVPITFAIVAFTGGDLAPSLLCALALPRTAASVAPLVGALCGALEPTATESASSFSTRLSGISLPAFKDVDVLELLEAATERKDF